MLLNFEEQKIGGPGRLKLNTSILNDKIYKENIKSLIDTFSYISKQTKKVIYNLISTDQSGYLKGRNIGFIIRLIQDVMDYCENNEQDGAILFLDLQKSFDTVNHEFLKIVLRSTWQ